MPNVDLSFCYLRIKDDDLQRLRANGSFIYWAVCVSGGPGSDDNVVAWKSEENFQSDTRGADIKPGQTINIDHKFILEYAWDDPKDATAPKDFFNISSDIPATFMLAGKLFDDRLVYYPIHMREMGPLPAQQRAGTLSLAARKVVAYVSNSPHVRMGAYYSDISRYDPRAKRFEFWGLRSGSQQEVWYQ